MAAGRSWAVDSLRGLSIKRAGALSTKFWILSLASVFAVALLLIGHSHLPSLSYLTNHPPHPGSPPPPPPPPPPSSTPPPYGPKDPPVPGELKIWDPPEMEALVHGVLAGEGIKRKPSYPLNPFPPSPMTTPPPDDGRQRPWLGSVICSAFDIERRMLIRYTWMKLFKDVPMDQRFVISNPGPEWMPVIQQENRTFGDLIVLDHLSEDDFTANTIKTVEYYRWLAEKSPRKYQFVSKMDTDLFLNARAMYDRKLRPRMAPRNSSTDELVATVNHTLVGQFYYDSYHKTSFPHGAIYTVTWDIVELLPKLQDEFHVVAGEDLTMAWLLMKARQKVTFVHMNESEKFEFDPKDMRPGERTPWARKDTDLTSSWHALYGEDVIAVHQLKKDEDWLMVAGVFDENGIRPMPPFPEEPPADEGEKPGYSRPLYHSIPDNYWEFDHDGTWLCNGVWKLEPGIGRDMKKNETAQ
ncbi:32735328-df86-41ad-9e67-04135fb3ccb0 [Thermothielavioides terrestris]|uniref:Hexosyltransferase n=2 Tax=Thermothielavioides terrestris TaxID=2587410 RepID=G2REI1_THETT|nr:uncharacterized protein THITE_2122864 [Thermothielavioides terrestris NRRL 8126]AEO70956.1 hypothetical protein THITE_2122864 [Thermothielavioides terrestris NRRL 8126]SPQ25049.1 32735328-df86-41ad-9e67-04135fb3ccb0 [Thermothielavioides terrestris]